MTLSNEARCVICGAAMREAFRARMLGRHDVRYFYCPACQHLRTEPPFWLEQAYTEAISRADTGLVFRNLQISRQLACVLHEYFDPSARYLDSAGGTGLLTRLMRDYGFNFSWEDPYCKNVMAAGFEAPPGANGFEAVTAFEALEHMTDPLQFIERAVSRSRTGTMIFTTELFEGDPPAADWWYYAFPTGQHISFFTRRTLERIGQELQLNFLSNGFLHMLTRQEISERAYRRILKKSGRGLFEKVAKRMGSLIEQDHRLMLGGGSAEPAQR